MKNILFVFFIIVSITLLYAENEHSKGDTISFEPLVPASQHRSVSQVVVHLLKQQHYKKRLINNDLSSETFDRYIEKFDHSRLYFLESDIKEFEKHRYLFDDYIGSGQIQAAFDIFTRYQQRFAERLIYIFQRLEQAEFDFSIDEYLEIDRENAAWATSKKALDETWRKRLKNEALNLKLAGKDWEGIKKALKKRYKRIQKNITQFQSEDVFQILMNSFAESYDPHTSYFSPKNYDDFKIRMSQSLEGIGARLTTENDYTLIAEIIVGGPADKSNDLHPKDKIIGVGQGPEGEIVDVIGWRLDDVVQLIRGKKGTIVNLEVLRGDALAGALPENVVIVRDKIKLEDQSATGSVIEIIHENQLLKFGVITIPAFYSDYEARQKGEKDYKSTTNDVERLLKSFQPDNIAGVIIDLRGNGGGYLNEAVDLTGLFIEKGAVVQVRNSNNRINVEKDYDPKIVYNGPLAVIVNRLSASASEIFAAAIQDYGRGIIIGGQSFGKGTVQSAFPLNRLPLFRNQPKKLGQLKYTIAKFYRIDGRSTQHVGVLPDLSFPSRFDFMEIGESSRDNALLWDQINTVEYDRIEELTGKISKLKQLQLARLANDEDYLALIENIAEYEKQKDIKQISLQEEKRKKEREEAEAKKSKSNVDDEKDDEKKLDFQINESAHVLGDYLLISKVQ